MTELISARAPRRNGEPVRLRARSRATGECLSFESSGLLLAAGALATPRLVRSFRLGSRWRSAGEGLSLHPASKVFALFDEPVRGWKGVPQDAGLEDPEDGAIRYEGVFTPPGLAALTMPLEGARLRWWMERYERVATFGFMIRDEARGRVRHPLGAGLPVIRYDLSDADMRRMASGIRRVGLAFLAAGARRVLLPVNRDGNEVSSESELEAAIAGLKPEELYAMAFHPLGTCGAGRVVDWDLAAGPGVWICDGSVVPESLGVNPQMTIYAFALGLARRLAGLPMEAACA